MSDWINRHELRVTGMSRSGNHAVLNWIFQQTEGRVCFLNCAEPRTNPFQTARPMDDGSLFRVTYDGFSWEREAAGNLSSKDWLIYSYEDCFLSTVAHSQFESRRDQWVGQSQQRIDVLILRDPFNLFASRMKSEYGEVTPLTAVRIWKQHARQFAGRRRFLPHGCVVIAFNRWVQDRSYRREVARRLQLRFTDAGYDEVAAVGGGSSFDALQYDGRASRMNVLQRWKYFADDASYRRLFDAEMLELSEEIFGSIPGTREVLQSSASTAAPLQRMASDRRPAEQKPAVAGRSARSVGDLVDEHCGLAAGET